MTQKGIGSIVIKSAPLIGVSGLIFTDGKMTGSMAMQGVGSVIIQSSNLIGVSGAIFDSGDITGSVVLAATSSRLGVSGNINISTGSVIITNEQTMQDIGSPCFKTSILIASGGYSDTWKIGGAGSKLEIHGVHISTNLAGTVRLLVSGTTNTAAVSPGLISEYFLKYASGATIEKTFSTPLIPAGPGSAIGFGTSSAGSTTVTIYGREVK